MQCGDTETVRAILHAKPALINTDLSESNEHRAIHFAVLRRDPAMVKLLMEAGANARKGIYPHRDATSALTIARDRQYHEIVAIIEEAERLRKPDPPIPPAQDEISAAISAGDVENTKRLLNADPSLLKRMNSDGGLLTLAVNRDKIEVVNLLLDLGADVDERVTLSHLEEPVTSWGMPLWNAALENNFEICELLLNRGADPNANVYASGWPLRNAWNHEDGKIKKLLLERGAKLQPYMVSETHNVEEAKRLLEQDPSEALASELLWSAADHGCPAIVELALPHIPWPADDRQWHWVIIQPVRGGGSEGHFASMALLLKHGINPDIARYGQTALHFAAAYRGDVSDEARARFAGMLIDAGASLTVRDDLLKSTPLGWACRWGRKKLADLLIARGANIAEPDAEPWATPAAWTKKMGHVIHTEAPPPDPAATP